jgi:pyruvate dehydrogenase E2 component (dihydrolipoamide acetyltransferase)
MALEFKLPDIGEGVAEGEIVKWLVEEGQSVEEHQPVVEVMTDKATVEIPAPSNGTLSKRLVGEGDVVPVGTVIFHLDTDGAAPAAAPAPAAAAPAPTPAPTPEPAPAPAAAAPAPAAGGGSVTEFKLPDVGEGVAEGEIVQWLVAEGDAVAEHQPVVEVMTDKATVEIPAPAAGRVTQFLAAAGDVVPVGQVIFHLETGAGAPVAAPAPAAAAPAPVAAPAPQPVMAAAAAAPAPAPAPAAAPVRSNGKVLAVPSARRVARELGVDLALVAGSGRNGVIRRADVEVFAAQGTQSPPAAPAPAAAPPAPASPEPTADETRVPFRGIRRKISEAMVRSKYTAPHFTVVEEIDVTDLVKVRTTGKQLAAQQGVKLTYMPFIMKAVASGLAKYPSLNSKLDEATQEVVTYQRVHLGIATDTDQGLVVPVVRDVQAKGMLQLATDLADLAERTRGGKVKAEELRGSTFSITNAGNIGGTLATPIINFPDVGILGVHRIVKRPGVVETPEGDRIEVRQYMNLSISVDHRLVDGATAARFLVHMQQLLENPGLLAL